MSIRRAPLLVLTAVLALSSSGNVRAQSKTPWLAHYREPAARLVAEATANAFAWQRLAVLTDTFGHRLSGSPQLERAIQWAADEMKRDGLENVHIEPVMVPKWVRGRERADIVQPAQHALAMLGLGDSVGTPAEGIEAEVLVVQSFAELDAKSALAKGRIVFLNVPFTNYGDSRLFRMSGPSRAAQHGAVATLIRSIGPTGLRLPHTGVLQYRTDAPKIPAAAVAAEDADLLQRMANRGQRIVVRLQMEAHFEGEVESANVVGELRGRERPEEIVVVGGHLDSWDVGAGASDDGGGCIVTWEALRLMKKLGLRPRRTVRVVLFTNEGERRAGGARIPRRPPKRAAQPRHDARIRHRGVPADRIRIQRDRARARDGQDHRLPSRVDRGHADRVGGRGSRHRAEACASMGCPASRSRSKGTTS